MEEKLNQNYQQNYRSPAEEISNHNKIIRETDMYGVLDPDSIGGRQDPKYSFEFPSRETFDWMSLDQLEKLSINKVAWQGRGGFDAI
jgi:hypothetical protein